MLTKLRFFAILMMCLLAGVEVDLFIPSFPELQRIFDLSPFMVQLTLSVNFIAYCICCLFVGNLGDRYNRRTVILISLAIFVAGSVCCVIATHYPILLLGRFLQGMGVAGFTILSYVVILDTYPKEQQAAKLSSINGVITLAMAFAPVIGSYVNLYFGWRGNFVLLLGLSTFCLALGAAVMPATRGNPDVSLSPKMYLPLLRDSKMMLFVFGIGFIIVPYWVFVGISPIYYMEALGISLAHFGFYQGAIAAVFSVMSILSPRIFKMFGQKKCLYWGMGACLLSGLLMALISILDINNPFIITGVMLLLSGGVVFPINILFPIAIDVIAGAQARATALMLALRLLLTALSLEGVSLIYSGHFSPIGFSMCAFIIIAMIFFTLLFKRFHIAIPGKTSVETTSHAPIA